MIWIILFHYTTRYSQLFSEEVPFSFNNGGEIGVAVFFVISGFFLGKPLLSNELQGGQSALRFVINKYWRLYPAYAIAVVLIYTIISFIGLPVREVGWKDFAVNLLFIYHPGFDYVDGAHWFISDLIKIQIFLSCLLVFSVEKRKLILYIMAILAISVLYIDAFSSNELLHKTCTFFSVKSFLNVVCGLLISIAKEKKEFCWAIISILLLSFLFHATLLFFIITLTFTMLVRKTECESRLLNNKLIIRIGRISFYWYLVHQNIGYAIIHSSEDYLVGVVTAIISTFILANILRVIVDKVPKKLL